MIYKMKNQIQNYHWGTRDYLPELLSLKSSNQPCAELWMGAHPKAPSEILQEDKWKSLYHLMKERGEAFPYLLKILSIESPLSIQVHPNIYQAQKGYEREEQLGIERNAGVRNYKDKNHKPEMIVALSDFWALKGLRDMEEIQANFQFAPESLREAWKNMDLKTFFFSIMTLDNEDKETLLQAYNAESGNSDESDWVRTLQSDYPGDISVLAPLFLNLVHLRPGEALFQSDGELHAYLKGNGVEIMANSDNVLRAGLTSKHMDLEELMSVVRFVPSKVEILKESEHFYPSHVPDFELGVWKDAKETTIPILKEPLILLNIGSTLEVSDRKQKGLILKKGESIFIDKGTEEIGIISQGKGHFYLARRGMQK